jgi:phosphatidate phosphatase APP1
MLDAVTHALSRVEGALDKAKLTAKWKTGWWECLTVDPYVGYGRVGGGGPDAFRLHGRVLDDKRTDREADLSRLDSVLLTLRRFESDEIPGARVRLEDGSVTREAETDDDGYFWFEFAPDPAPDPDEPWHDVALTLLAPVDGEPATATGRVRVPSPGAEFAVVSDVDDTVLRTGATDKLQFARTVLLNNATTRRVFPGVGAFYRALVSGPDAEGYNPIFYVSSSPNNLRHQFTGTFRHRGLPDGPLFLKDFGIDSGKFIKSGHAGHKLEQIKTLLDFYPRLPFVLVGDSGQEDPEIYQEAVRRHPGRIRAVFVRDVTDPKRDREVHHIARDVEARGVPMRLVESTDEAAAAAAELGLVSDAAVGEVREAAAEEEAAEAAGA